MKISEFNEVYDKYYLMVMKVAFNVLGDYHYAQDICQEVFITLHKNLDEIDVNLVKAWLLVVTQRKAIDFTRKSYVKRESCDEMHVTFNDFPYDVENICIQRIAEEDMYDKLKEQDRHWYEIVKHVLIEGDTQKNVAKKLGISLPDLRIKKNRAKEWLQENLTNPDDF